MKFLHKYIRYIILTASIITAVILYYVIMGANGFQIQYQQYVRLADIYALFAITFLYFTLLASPLYKAFPGFPFKALYIKARRALGVSAFIFSLCHTFITFFILLGGFSGLKFLNRQYLLAIILSATALLILTLLTITSFDLMVKKLGRSWKKLHRFVYLAGLLIVIHALLLGTHFIVLSSVIPEVFFTALIILLTLEAARIDAFTAAKFPPFWRYLILLIMTLFLLWMCWYFIISPASSLHGGHAI